MRTTDFPSAAGPSHVNIRESRELKRRSAEGGAATDRRRRTRRGGGGCVRRWRSVPGEARSSAAFQFASLTPFNSAEQRSFVDGTERGGSAASGLRGEE